MVFCDHCVKDVFAERHDDCYLTCTSCGKVLEDQYFTEEPTFVKDSAGKSKLSGSYVKAVQSEFSLSRERTLHRASKEMENLSLNLGVSEQDMIHQALAFYEIALEKNFTRGRKSEQLRMVHVCEATLTKRLIEYENTDSSSLTIEELNTMTKEHEKNPVVLPNSKFKGSTSNDLLCEHKDSEVPYFALGLCKTCYKDFEMLSGGFGGLDPPAFQRAESERVKKTLSKENADVLKASNGTCQGQIEDAPASVLERDNTSTETQDESGNFSDIDDHEVDGYIFNSEEKYYYKIIWESANREYLEEQAAKEAAVAAEKKIYEENMKNCPVESRKLYESTTAAVAKSKKEMKQRRAQEAKNSRPAQSAAEAACQMVKNKRLSKRVNFDRLAKLFEDEPANTHSPKKVRFDLASDDHSKFQSKVDDD